MPEQKPEKNVKRWVGYVCPDCRMIFRMEGGLAGRRAQCPGCQALVRLGGLAGKQSVAQELEERENVAEELPATEPVAEPVEEPGDESSTGEFPDDSELEEETGSGRRRIKKRIKKSKPKKPAWEKDDGTVERTSWKLVAVLALLLIGLGAGVAYWAGTVVEIDDLRRVMRGNKPAETEDEDNSEANVEVSGVIGDVEDVVAQFLKAPTVDKLVKTVRDRGRTEPLIRKYYEENEYRPAAFRSVGSSGQLQALGTLYSVIVEMSDFSLRPVAVEKIGKRYAVDWESWMGYSEVSWEAFKAARTVEPKVFRVRIASVEYYNYGFSDDRKWQSYALRSPDGNDVLYGYAPRYSDLTNELIPLDRSLPENTRVVTLRYPDEPGVANQVLIERVLTGGWVLDGGE